MLRCLKLNIFKNEQSDNLLILLLVYSFDVLTGTELINQQYFE